MGEVMALLERRGYQIAEGDLALALAELLPEQGNPVVALSSADREYLARFSGAAPPTGEQVVAMATRRATAATAEVAQTLSRTDVARLLGITPSRVSHRHSDGQLFGFHAGAGRVLYPDWQFAGRDVVPHLDRVLGAIGAVHPVALRQFMLTADADLVIDDRPVSPREWLLAAGDPVVVVALSSSLGDQV